jgi:hypothetical protein
MNMYAIFVSLVLVFVNYNTKSEQILAVDGSYYFPVSLAALG